MSLKSVSICLALASLTACEVKEQKMTEKTAITGNPLMAEWNTPFGAPPFDLIENEHYLPAFKESMAQEEAEVEAISTNTAEPTFKNTIEALELSGSKLKRVSNIFYSVEAANTNEVLKATAKEIAPLLAAHQDKILLNDALFQRIKKVQEFKSRFRLSPEEDRLLEETFKRFVRAGANVEGADRERLKVINGRLAELGTQFGENLLNETNGFELHITDEADVADLPADLKSLGKQEAKNRGKEGWVFTTQRPSCNPFLQSSTNREFRKAIFNGYAKRGDNDNENDNKSIIEEIALLSLEKANLLGYDSHADYVLSDAMAKNPEAVYQFMDDIWPKALAMAKQERSDLAAAMAADGINAPFRGWDWRYYVEKIRAERYAFNEEETKPYFEFNAVREGCFMLANKLFGLSFKELDNIPKWHESQQVYEVLEEDGSHLGIIYMDFFARDSKRGGAWMNELRPQQNVNGFVTPIVTNNFNYPPPTESGPSLLNFTEAQTLFHEFGHGLHGLFSNVKYASLSGTNVPRDFVEFPSQVMENWMSEPEILKMYAKHYQTGEVIPDELIERMNAANQFNTGFATVEYMAAAYLDLAWYTINKKQDLDANQFEAKAMSKIGLIDEILPRYRSTYFGHIWGGGYSSGYYSYLWSEVLDADAFAAFKENGILDKETASRFRMMLSQGGSRPSMDLYKVFRGKEPDPKHLLIKKGFEDKD
jgi:peptidyl-dipeptidase Dcp